MTRSAQIRKAALQIAEIIEAHLAKLPAEEREARQRAFRKAVARVGARRAKSAKPDGTGKNRVVARQR